MNNTYLEKRLYAMRKKQASGIDTTVQDKTLQIVNPKSSVPTELIIYGATRQAASDTAISPEAPRELLTADSFNLIVSNRKNELTDDYMAEFYKNTNWSYDSENCSWSNSSYKKLQVPLTLKPNTAYTLYRTCNIRAELTNPVTAICYGGVAYNNATIRTDSGFNQWLWHASLTPQNIKFKNFAVDNAGLLWFISTGIYQESEAIKIKNGWNTNGLIITEGTYTRAQMETQKINIPSSVTLDNGTVIALDMLSADYQTAEHHDYIAVQNNKVIYNSVCFKCELKGTEVWYMGQQTNPPVADGYRRFWRSVPRKTSTILGTVCNMLNVKRGSGAASDPDYNSVWLNQGDNKAVFITVAQPDVAALKEWLSSLYEQGNPLTMILLRETPISTDITASDLGRQLLSLRLKQHNTISTDNYLSNKIKITYKA